MPYYDRPVLICDRCLKEIKPGASVRMSKIVTFKGMNFASTLNEQYAYSWPLFDGPEGTTNDTIYEHNINCLKQP